MNRMRASGVAMAGFLWLLLATPQQVGAAWVNTTGTQFQVGGQLRQLVPTNAGTTFVDAPTCGTQGGTSLALVPTLLQGLKVTGVDPVLNPLALVVSCIDSNATVRSRLNFINPADGKVIQQISTSPAPNTNTVLPSTGYPHFVFRPDKGDILACGANGALYKIDFLKATGTPPTAPTTQLANPPFPSGATASCTGLTWDAEADVIYMG